MKTIKKIYTINSSVDKVWEALVNPKIIEKWSGAKVEMSDQKDFNFKFWDGDIFGKNLEVTQTNLVDALTASAVVVMGEGSEQTPLAVISETSNVEFVDKNPTDREIKELMLTLDEDVYSAPLSQVKWIKGGK